jgi:hypothetical protein
MNLRNAFCSAAAILALLPAATHAQEDPEAVYAKMQRAALSGNSDEVIGFASAKQKADLASKSKAEKDAVIGFMAKLMPKSYSVTDKSIAADGNSALLRATGSGGLGGGAMYLNANFVKEAGAWKVDQWDWSNNKPGPMAKAETKAPLQLAQAKPEPKPAAPAAPAKAAPAAPAAPAPAKAEPAPTPAAKAAPAPRRAARDDRDARECLAWVTNTEIARCAEKFR